jgi:hypothetical protein
MIEHPFVLTDKVGLVTGAGRGVGKGAEECGFTDVDGARPASLRSRYETA